MRKLLFGVIAISVIQICYAQKRVLRYPFEFEKSAFTISSFESFFLPDPISQNFMLVLKDNKKAEYVLLNNNLKLISKFSPEGGLKNTIFNFSNEDYLGGTASNGKFYFVYKVTDHKFMSNKKYYQVEIVDVANQSLSNKQLFEISEDEDLLVSFGNFGNYYSVTVNDKSGELKFYGLNSSGETFIKSIPFQIPTGSSKKKLSDYLENMKVLSVDDEPGLESATEKVKLFHSPSKISIVVNEGDQPTHMVNIDTKTFMVEQKFIDHSELTKNEKGKSYINSFLYSENLFALVLNQKNIRIAIYDVASGTLKKTHEINDETNLSSFAEAPTEVQRKGGKPTEKEIDETKKLIRALDKGSEAIMIYTGKNGKLNVTVGTYDPIKPPSGGTVTKTFTSYHLTNEPNANRQPNYIGGGYERDDHTYVIGVPSYTSNSARYYKSTHFKLVLDPATLNLTKGAPSMSVNEQIKDYLEGIDNSAHAKKQFKLNGKQYFGYYDRDEKAYIVEEIFIR